MNFKLFIIELFQASSFLAVITFLFAILSYETYKHALDMTSFAFVFGGVPIMLAKRFLVSFLKEIKQ
ncbi:hypothetical protein [Pseudoalteromonas sp. MTN2-4]|uniref:hypothetical protein n=1 Tax=Pseudoalteromonas sp. MTN2-4 TaxID=3056555 RepID=UPI0036F37FE9